MRCEKSDIIELIYLDKNNLLSQRHVKVIDHKEDRLIAYCYTRQKFRSFKTESILGIRKVRLA